MLVALDKSLTAEEVIALLNLKPLPEEGGYYRETYRSKDQIPESLLQKKYQGVRQYSTAIYYLLTPEEFSALHAIPQDEVFHFYLGDPVEMLQIFSEDKVGRIVLGSNPKAGQQMQVVVPGGTWQGLRLQVGGAWALLGTTVAPGFDFQDFCLGKRKELLEKFPSLRKDILKYTR